MALFAQLNDTKFGIGDIVRVTHTVVEDNKKRNQIFEGMVIAFKNDQDNKSFTVRRIGDSKIGIERIFPLLSPMVTKIEVVRQGTKGVKRAKLYYTRDKSKKEVDIIFSRAAKRK